MTPPPRSFLFSPGNHARRVEKALAGEADAVILDLEDAVAVAEKERTRDPVVAALRAPHGPRGYVRVNPADGPFCFGDVQAVVQQGVDGIMLPKVETAAQLATIDWLIAQLESARGLPVGGIDLLPIIETARGLANIGAITGAGTRVRRLAFGAGDFTLDLDLTWSRDETELLPARAALVLASRAAGWEPPVDTVWVDLADPEGLAASARQARRLGFAAKMCIHPAQVGPVNQAFMPTPPELDRARAVVAAFEAAEQAGLASIQVDGGFVDYPVADRARRLLAAAEARRKP